MRGMENAGLPVILPLYPQTRGKLREYRITPSANLYIVDPVGYLEMVWLEANCSLVTTDSGGVQKEAYFFAKLCATLRDETEWVELVESGWNILADANEETISGAIDTAWAPTIWTPIYGQGAASLRIVEAFV